MKAVIQKVESASVTVENNIISSIRNGLVVFLGIGTNDSTNEIMWLTDKISKLRVFENFDKNINDVSAEILLVKPVFNNKAQWVFFSPNGSQNLFEFSRLLMEIYSVNKLFEIKLAKDQDKNCKEFIKKEIDPILKYDDKKITSFDLKKLNEKIETIKKDVCVNQT